MCLTHRGLYRHTVTEQLVRAEIGLVKSDSSGVACGFEFLEGGGNLGGRVTSSYQVRPQQVGFNGPVI